MTLVVTNPAEFSEEDFPAVAFARGKVGFSSGNCGSRRTACESGRIGPAGGGIKRGAGADRDDTAGERDVSRGPNSGGGEPWGDAIWNPPKKKAAALPQPP